MSLTLVTGATGFLGTHLVERMRREHRDVVALGRDDAKLAQLAQAGVRVMRQDLATPFTSGAQSELRGVSSIIHCAALSAPYGPDRAFAAANVDATQTMANLASELGVTRFVYVSTPAVYFRLADQFDIAESAALPHPLTAYAATKRQGEKIVLDKPAIGPIVLRPRGLYGKGDTALLPRLAAAARSGPLPLLRDGTARTDITHVDDAVTAILAALDAPPTLNGEIFNASGGQAWAIRDIVERACARLSLSPRWRAMPLSLLLGMARVNGEVARFSPWPFAPRLTVYGVGLFAYSQTLDLSKAAQMLNWQPRVSFEDGLARTFDP